MSTLNLVGDWVGGPGTGALGGPPSGHNYKRAVYRPPPKDFSVEVLSPTKFGSGYCYGMRIIPIHSGDSDSRSTRSGSSHHEYEVWRRWEDCLWFQEILESEYALMARQKRSRLAAGKGVKKNGVYIHSDMASSWDSLPPGPDANTIAKSINQLVPSLTKKGTLFRASQATIDQRSHEFKALVEALFQQDVPMLIRELRETRLVRDFFGYWRRDLDHDRKRQSAKGKEPSRARHSITGSMFAMYFSASNTSLHLTPPPLDSDLPPSPALPKSQSPSSSDSSRPNSIEQDKSRRRSTGKAPPHYATSDSSASTVSVASSSRAPQSPADMTFYVSNRGSLALKLVDDDEGQRAEYINAPLSAPGRVQTAPWPRDLDPSFPSQDDDILDFAPEVGKTRYDPVAVSGEFHPGLQALPEECELVPETPASPSSTAVHSDIEEVPRVPARRPRNSSCSDRTNRQCLIFSADLPRSAPAGGSFNDPVVPNGLRLDTDVGQFENDVDPRTPTNTTTTSSSRPSSAAWSGFSNFTCDGASSRTSWRTSMASDTSFAQSFATSFADGSCADFDRQSRHSFATSFANGSCADIDDARDHAREAHRSMVSLASRESGRKTALGHRDSSTTLNSLLSDLSLESGILPRSLTPPPSGTVRRSLSAGSKHPSSIMATLNGQEDWYEQQEDFIDAYFYDPGMQAAKPRTRASEAPQTPPPQRREPPLKPFNRDVATPDRFPQQFQHRPPGQFHLPWSPLASPAASSSEFSTPPSTPPPAAARAPGTPGTPGSPAQTSLTLKAVLGDSIVLLRVPRAAPLGDVRARLREKFAAQEGVQLSRAFVLGWSWAQAAGGGPLRSGGSGGGRPRANSASSVGTLNPQALRYVYAEEEWREAVAACVGGKMTVRLFNAQPV